MLRNTKITLKDIDLALGDKRPVDGWPNIMKQNKKDT